MNLANMLFLLAVHKHQFPLYQAMMRADETSYEVIESNRNLSRLMILAPFIGMISSLIQIHDYQALSPWVVNRAWWIPNAVASAFFIIQSLFIRVLVKKILSASHMLSKDVTTLLSKDNTTLLLQKEMLRLQTYYECVFGFQLLCYILPGIVPLAYFSTDYVNPILTWSFSILGLLTVRSIAVTQRHSKEVKLEVTTITAKFTQHNSLSELSEAWDAPDANERAGKRGSLASAVVSGGAHRSRRVPRVSITAVILPGAGRTQTASIRVQDVLEE